MNQIIDAKPNASELRFYDALQQLNHICDSAKTLEQLLERSLDLMLGIFNCDRAWLTYPCDSAASFLEVKMERTRPEWPGAYEQGISFPIGSLLRRIFKSLDESDGPIINDSRTDAEFRDGLSAFSVKTQLLTMLKTKIGASWVLGIHFCERHPQFDSQDIRIFSEYANRLSEALNYVLMLRDMQQSKERYRLLINSLIQGVIFHNAEGVITEVNPAAEKILGLSQAGLCECTESGSWCSPLDQSGVAIEREQHPVLLAIKTGQLVKDVVLKIFNPSNNTERWISVNASPQYDEEGLLLECVVCTFSDITSLRIADKALVSHLRFLDSMDRISRITASSLSVNDMLNSVLNEMLEIFDCSRAWFLYPCDPDADTWSIPLTRTRPEWPGIEVGVEVPLNQQITDLFTLAASSEEPITFDTEASEEHAKIPEAIEFHIKSQMAIKLAPKIGLPWMLGIHHCEASHPYSDDEKELFTEVSRRIADSLNMLITLRDFKASEARFRTLVEHAPEAIIVFDVGEDSFTDVNENAAKLFKLSRETLLKNNFLKVSPYQQSDGSNSGALMKEYIAETMNGGAPVFDWEFDDDEQQTVPCEVRLILLPDSNRVLIRCSITDITERLKAQEYLQHLAHHDALTGLPNRIMLVDRLEQAIVRASRHHKMVAIVFVDLDHFKIVNDTLGHDVGDICLKKVAQIIDKNLRATDTVARFGGDEFVILLEEVHRQEEVSVIVRKLLSAIKAPMVCESQEISMSASIGVSLFPDDSDDVTTLLKYADVAMYRAKDIGRNTHEFYSTEMSVKAFERLTLEARLRKAVRLGEFQLVYQPQFDVRSGIIVGAEALMRWYPEDSASISPDIFVPLLEETGLIVEVGEWVFDTALVQLKKFESLFPGFRMSVNISSRQFQAGNLIHMLEKAINTHQINPEQVELEITESLLMEHHHITLATLQKISNLGLHLSIDDFGTGYSSLSYLKQFPIDTLKIDRSFMSDINVNPDDEAIVVAIIALAKCLKLKLVAEGVETLEQYQFIRDSRCHLAQGFYFSKPLSADKLVEYLSSLGNKLHDCVSES